MLSINNNNNNNNRSSRSLKWNVCSKTKSSQRQGKGTERFCEKNVIRYLCRHLLDIWRGRNRYLERINRTINRQFEVDAGRVYAGMREALAKDKENDRPRYTDTKENSTNGEKMFNIKISRKLVAFGRACGKGMERETGTRNGWTK